MSKLPSEDPLPIDQLAQLDSEGSISMVAVLPAVVIVALVVIGIGLYLFRRGKNWNEVGAAMRAPEPGTDEDETPSTEAGSASGTSKARAEDP